MLGLGMLLTLLGFGAAAATGGIGLAVIGTIGAVFLLIGIIALFVQLAR